MARGNERRTEAILVNIEPSFKVIMERFLNSKGQSASSYCRSLVLKDLIAQGLLTEQMVLDSALG